MPADMAGTTQHEGGSEWTQVSALDAKNGKAVGFTPNPFSQVIQVKYQHFNRTFSKSVLF